MHRISDNRMTPLQLKNLRIFAEMCGEQAMPNVTIVTTMWGEVTRETGEKRELELMQNFWGAMLDQGCKTERFKDSHDSAWDITKGIAERGSTTIPLIVEQMVNGKKDITQTAAWQV